MVYSIHWINETHLVSKKQTRKQIRRSILDDWSWQCAYCGDCIKDSATLDHIIPVVSGGLTVKGNLAACCQKCNCNKSNKNVWEWFKKQAFYCKQREEAILAWLLSDGRCPPGSRNLLDGNLNTA